MAGLNLQASDHASRYLAETALIPACYSIAGGSSNPPKFGTLIPNRIFVGGIPSNTTEQELKGFFSSFGQVKDVKIISDRLGVSKGSYGFVTFESQEMAEKIIKNESETLVFKDRKLNIGHAIRKQQVFPRPDMPTALFFAGGAVPYGFQNGMAVFPLSGQEYPMLTQTATPYATMVLPQPGVSTTLYLPPSLHSNSATSPYAPISQHAVTAAMQQQHFQQNGGAAGLSPTVVGHLAAPVAASANNTGNQSNSPAAVMAAAAAAMAAAVQWPQQPAQTNTHQQNPQQLAAAVAAAQNVAQTAGNQNMGQSATMAQQQAVAMAAAVAAQQQAAWRWSPSLQQSQPPVLATSPSQSSVGAVTTSSVTPGSTATTLAVPSQNAQLQQQGSTNASLGPPTYLYSPLTGSGHELMFFHQTSSPFPANSTSDYSTDHSTHSSSILESAESLSFQCDGTPLGRHNQHFTGQLANSYNNPHIDSTCLSPYAAFAPLLDIQTQTNGIGCQNASVAPTHLQQFRPNPQAASLVPAPQTLTNPHLISIVNASPTQHKAYAPNLSHVSHGSAGSCPRQLPSTVFGSTSLKGPAISDLTSTSDLCIVSSSSQNLQSQNVSAIPANAGSVVDSPGPTAVQVSQSVPAALSSNTA